MNLDRISGRRMPEAELRGVEAQARRRGLCRFMSIKFVAKNRMANAGQMHAQLV